jgi:NAD(P)H-hydrate epimerase
MNLENEITTEKMVIQDINSEYLGIPRYLLMENAGAQIANFCRTLITNQNTKIAIFCGIGGNGGDGFVAARHLHNFSSVHVYLNGSQTKIKSKSALKNYLALKNIPKIKIQEIQQLDDIKKISIESFDFIIDGILGTGLRQDKIREPIKTIIELINTFNDLKKPIISIDIPSGLKNDGKQADTIVKPTYTVALHRPKIGTYFYGGTIHIAPIGIPPESEHYTGPGLFTLYPKRNKNSHKGQNGKILIIGGSKDYHGSPILAGKAAFALNIDLVYLIVPEKIASVIRSSDWRFIVKTYPEEFLSRQHIQELIEPMINQVDAILIGPGLGTENETFLAVKFLFKLIPPDKPVIIDADALKTCKNEILPKDTILTPHAGEFTILTNKKIPIENDANTKLSFIQKAIQEYDPSVTWVVKGPTDIIVSNNQHYFNTTGTPAMTTGGTGDILAGLITAIRTVVKNSLNASAMATFLIGKAGEKAEKEIFSIEKLIDHIPRVLLEIDKFIDEEINIL